MGYCPNCNTRLTCGCQKRVSTKGVAGCANCVTQLNGGTAPIIQTEALPKDAPKNLTGTYKGPGTQI